jgi:hypothetical protein
MNIYVFSAAANAKSSRTTSECGNHALARETNLFQNGSISQWKDLGDIREHFTWEEEKVLKKIRF